MGPEELRRYERQIVLPEVGVEGQRKLRNARVLAVGTGGLGSPAALYLAAAGVGTLAVADFDAVEPSNLQRQILFSDASAGKPKAREAAARLRALNPEIRVEAHETRLDAANALELLGRYDIVVDGTDNFPARYLINDACALLGKPDVHGAVLRFQGQVSVFWAGKGPCYRCLHPEPPAQAPSCAEAGVLGALPGVIGALQAAETLKLILGAGRPLLGRLLLFDALAAEWRELRVRKAPGCPLCGERPSIRSLTDCGAACEARAAGAEAFEIGVEELQGRLERAERLVLLDVREPGEHAAARIPGAQLIPLGELARRLAELDPAQDIVVHCKSGGRSARAVRLLRENGFARARSLAGGMDAWSTRARPEAGIHG